MGWVRGNFRFTPPQPSPVKGEGVFEIFLALEDDLNPAIGRLALSIRGIHRR